MSTDKQRKEGNLTRQVERLERFAAEHFPGEPIITIQETGSGLNHERKGFVRLIDAILDGRESESSVSLRTASAGIVVRSFIACANARALRLWRPDLRRVSAMRTRNGLRARNSLRCDGRDDLLHRKAQRATRWTG